MSSEIEEVRRKTREAEDEITDSKAKFKKAQEQNQSEALILGHLAYLTTLYENLDTLRKTELQLHTSASKNVSESLAIQETDEYTQYLALGKLLKDTAEVEKLVTKIKQVADSKVEPLPFIALHKSSGWGKTQMAFSLLARNIPIHHVLAMKFHASPQPIYTSFSARTRCFVNCAELDVKRFLHPLWPSHFEFTNDEPKNLYGYIWAVLTGSDFKGPKTRPKIEEVLNSIPPDRRPVFFLDEFATRDTEDRTIYALMRNIFRSLNLVVIVSSTNNSAFNIIDKDSVFSRKHPGAWCSVITEFPPFLYQPSSRHPPYIKTLVEHSRPWFAKLAVAFYDRNSTGTLEEMLMSIYSAVSSSKRSKFHDEIFIRGQICLLLSVSYTRNPALINGHFADLDEEENFDLIIDSDTLKKEIKIGSNHTR